MTSCTAVCERKRSALCPCVAYVCWRSGHGGFCRRTRSGSPRHNACGTWQVDTKLGGCPPLYTCENAAATEPCSNVSTRGALVATAPCVVVSYITLCTGGAIDVLQRQLIAKATEHWSNKTLPHLRHGRVPVRGHRGRTRPLRRWHGGARAAGKRAMREGGRGIPRDGYGPRSRWRCSGWTRQWRAGYNWPRFLRQRSS